MRLRQLVGAAAVVAVIGLGDVAPAEADHGRRVLATRLSGAEEFPGPGDPDGSGFAAMVVDVGRGRICYALAVHRITPAVMAHIHEAPAGAAGPIVVNLDAPARGFSANCAAVDEALAAEIAASPDQFYVNVHTADFTAGAVRGQLG